MLKKQDMIGLIKLLLAFLRFILLQALAFFIINFLHSFESQIWIK